eukprot:995-Heterococcus_DN1.PRE.1
MVALNAEAAKLTLEARNPHITAAVDSGVLVVTGWTLLSARLHWCLRAQQRVTQHLRAVAALAEITACCSSSGQLTVDLHGLHVTEALDVVKSLVAQAQLRQVLMLSPLARCSIAAIAAVLMSHEYHRWIVLDTHHNADCITLMARDYNPRLAATSSLKAYRPPTTA